MTPPPGDITGPTRDEPGADPRHTGSAEGRVSVPSDSTPQNVRLRTLPLFPSLATHTPGSQAVPVDDPDDYGDVFDIFSSGYLPTVLRAGGKKRKLDSAPHSNDLQLAPTSTNVIDLDLLVEDYPELGPVVAPIRDPIAFLDLFTDPDATPDTRRPLSRGMLSKNTDMCKYNIVEPLNLDAAPTLFQALCVSLWCILFMVPKKLGLGRLVIDARPVNIRMKKPGNMGLPSLHGVIRTVLSFRFAAKADGRSYFYQFLLHPAIRPFFKARLANVARGFILAVQLVRMPMGWCYSPRIAQHVSNILIRLCGVAWLDDFIVGGATREEFDKRRAVFLERIRRYNVDLDDTELQPQEYIKAVGLEFDLRASQYRLDPDWVDKRRTQWSGPTPTTYREWFRHFGTLIWADYAAARPLWLRAESLAALKQMAKDCRGKYDDKATLPPYCHANLQEWQDEVLLNKWLSPAPERKDPTTFLFSDASDTHGAWVRITQDMIQEVNSWERDDDCHIFLAELDAFLRGITAPNIDMATTLGCIDNTAAQAAIAKGHSSSYPANCMLRTALGHKRPWTLWVSTLRQIADRFTRGSLPPTTPLEPTPDDLVALDYVAQRLRGSESEANLPKAGSTRSATVKCQQDDTVRRCSSEKE